MNAFLPHVSQYGFPSMFRHVFLNCLEQVEQEKHAEWYMRSLKVTIIPEAALPHFWHLGASSEAIVTDC
jgi:hypothetical protein